MGKWLVGVQHPDRAQDVGASNEGKPKGFIKKSKEEGQRKRRRIVKGEQPGSARKCDKYATTLRFIRKKNCTLYMIAKYINCTF